MKRIIAGIISLAITVCAFSSCDNDNNDEKSKTKISESNEIVKKEKLNDEQLEEIYDDIGDEYYDVDISPMEITDGYCVYLDLSYNNETYTVPIYVYCTDDEWRLYPD